MPERKSVTNKVVGAGNSARFGVNGFGALPRRVRRREWLTFRTCLRSPSRSTCSDSRHFVNRKTLGATA